MLRFLPLLLLAAGCATSGGVSPEAQARYERGWELLDKNDFKGALPEFDEALRRQPDFAKAYRARGGCFAELNDLPRALADFDRAVELNPQDALAFYNRGLVRQKAGDEPGARRDYDRGIELDPSSVAAWSNRGALRILTGDIAGAVEDLLHASRLENPPHQVFHNLGRAYQLLDRHAEAVEAYTRAIEKGARAHTWSYRAVVKGLQKDLPGARQDLAKALELDPRSAEVHMNDGHLKEMANDAEGALAAFAKAVGLDPKSGPAHRARGTCHLRAARYDAAVEDLTHALALTPGHAAKERLATALAARAQAQLSRGSRLQALPDLDKALQLAPPGWRERHAVLALRGQARTATGDLDGAAEDYRDALRVAPAAWEHRGAVDALLKEVLAPRPFSSVLDAEGSFLVCESRNGVVQAVVIGLVPAQILAGEQGLSIKIGGITMNLAGNRGLILIGPGGSQSMNDLPAAWARDLARRFRAELKAEPGLTIRKWLADEVRTFPAPAIEKLLQEKK